MKRLILVVATLALLAPTLTESAGAATALSSDRLTTIKSKVNSAVTSRLTKLDELKDQVNASRFVTTSHKSGLLVELQADKDGLTALNAKIQAETDGASIATDAKKIVTDYRVYVLEGPKVREVIAIDTVATAITQLQAIAPKLAASIQVEKTKGKNVAEAETALSDLNTNVDAVSKSNPTLTDVTLALQPNGWPNNGATIKATRKTLGTESTQAKAARSDIETIKSVLSS